MTGNPRESPGITGNWREFFLLTPLIPEESFPPVSNIPQESPGIIPSVAKFTPRNSLTFPAHHISFPVIPPPHSLQFPPTFLPTTISFPPIPDRCQRTIACDPFNILLLTLPLCSLKDLNYGGTRQKNSDLYERALYDCQPCTPHPSGLRT
jgi:hypothetical protein